MSLSSRVSPSMEVLEGCTVHINMLLWVAKHALLSMSTGFTIL